MDSVVQQRDDEEYDEHLAFLKRIFKVTMELQGIYRRGVYIWKQIQFSLVTWIHSLFFASLGMMMDFVEERDETSEDHNRNGEQLLDVGTDKRVAVQLQEIYRGGIVEKCSEL